MPHTYAICCDSPKLHQQLNQAALHGAHGADCEHQAAIQHHQQPPAPLTGHQQLDGTQAREVCKAQMNLGHYSAAGGNAALRNAGIPQESYSMHLEPHDAPQMHAALACIAAAD